MPERAAALPNEPRQHGAMEYSQAPVDLDVVRLYRLGRIREQLKMRDYAGIVLFDQINTRYATDATNMQIWCSHYETRCVFVPTEGPVILFDSRPKPVSQIGTVATKTPAPPIHPSDRVMYCMRSPASVNARYGRKPAFANAR